MDQSDCVWITKPSTKSPSIGIPHQDWMLDKLHGPRFFSKIDLESDYYQILIREGDKWKATLKAKVGLYG